MNYANIVVQSTPLRVATDHMRSLVELAIEKSETTAMQWLNETKILKG